MSSTIYKSPTFRLFRRQPSFSEGASRLLDFSGSNANYNLDQTENQADNNSISADWYAIGFDLNNAVMEYEQEIKKTPAAK